MNQAVVGHPARDLVIHVADNSMGIGVQALLNRPAAIGIRELQFQAFPHPRRDPGVLNEAHAFLRAFLRDFNYALVMFDREGSGGKGTAVEIAEEVQARLNQCGWRDRSCVVVIDPELEAWAWNRSAAMAEILGWASSDELYRWLEAQGFLNEAVAKPARPKEALRSAIERTGTPWSSALFRQIATHADLASCTDASFERFRRCLQHWFAPR